MNIIIKFSDNEKKFIKIYISHLSEFSDAIIITNDSLCHPQKRDITDGKKHATIFYQIFQ